MISHRSENSVPKAAAAASVALLAASLVFGGGHASAATNPDLCYIVADAGGGNGGDDLLVSFDRTMAPTAPLAVTTLGTGTGTFDIEAADLWPGNDTLYAVDADELGTIDLVSGVYTTLGAPFGTASGADGDQALSDADGIAFDPFEFFIWAVERNVDPDGSTGPMLGPDYLFKIDPTTGAFIPDAFGPGVDYVVSTPVQTGSPDLDDIAVSTVTGEIFAVANDSATVTSQFLVTLDPLTGAQTEVGPLGVADIEGLTFSPVGNLYATDGSNEMFYDINPATGIATNGRDIAVGFDYESVTCLTGDTNTLAGTVFVDDNADGDLDPGDDRGQPGVTVELVRDTNGNGVADPGEPVVGTRVTDPNGDYDFEIAAVGDFVVRVDPSTLPTGATTTSPGALPVSFSDVGQDIIDQDFGIELNATVGDFVFVDLDSDGIQDVGEPGIEGVSVELFDAGGTSLGTTTTDANGAYSFDVTGGESYSIVVTPPAGRTFTSQNQGGDDTVDSDVDAAGSTGTIVPAVGANPQLGDAGIVPATTASIGDFVFLDLDSDGVQDAGEPGIPNIPVDLLDASGAVISSVQTDASGAYEFAGLTPGQTYSVRVNAPTGAEFTNQNTGGDDAVDSDVDATGVTGAIVPAVGANPDVGDAGIVPATLRGTLFSDTDSDGTRDPGEPGVPGITVRLTDPAGGTVSTTTDSNGDYVFVGVVPGPGYRVTFDTPAIFSPTTGADSDVGPDGSVTITLASGDNVGDSDAGIVAVDQPELPRTGSPTNGLLQIGAITFLAGVALLAVGRRRFRLS